MGKRPWGVGRREWEMGRREWGMGKDGKDANLKSKIALIP
jgi:hypothetical protein